MSVSAGHDVSPRAAAQHDGRVALDVSRDASQGAGAARQLSRDDRAATRDHPMVETLRYRAIIAAMPRLAALAKRPPARS